MALAQAQTYHIDHPENLDETMHYDDDRCSCSSDYHIIELEIQHHQDIHILYIQENLSSHHNVQMFHEFVHETDIIIDYHNEISKQHSYYRQNDVK